MGSPLSGGKWMMTYLTIHIPEENTREARRAIKLLDVCASDSSNLNSRFVAITRRNGGWYWDTVLEDDARKSRLERAYFDWQ
jgi:hypothetical protein